MLLKELQTLDVINVIDGNRLGKITDLEINYENGKIISFTVADPSFSNFLFRNKNVVVPWEKVIRVGKEVIIINHEIVKNI